MRRMELKNRKDRKQGQTLIFALMVLVIITIVALWNFDLHKILNVKSKARNGGDAAALAGARWQGITLNTVGQINVMQAVALTEALSRGETDFSQIEAMGDLGARVSFTGPMVGVAAAQQFAKNNGIYNNEAFANTLRRHADEIRDHYHQSFAAPFPSLSGSPDFWTDYARMYDTLADQGVAVEIENPRWFGGAIGGGHMLLNPAFYDAIASADWCWFHFNASDLLSSYHTWRDWPALPYINQPEPLNAELLNCGIDRIEILDQLSQPQLDGLFPVLDQLAQPFLQSDDGGLGGNQGQGAITGNGEPPTEVDREIIDIEITWYTYSGSRWGQWTDLVDEAFPWEGNVKAQYNYAGADAAIRIESGYDRMSPVGGADSVLWTSAAKPFGFLEGLDGPERPDAFRMILPAFHETRMIPIDASSAPAGGSQPGWSEFVYEILPRYMEVGPHSLPRSNWYVQQLLTWENASFRAGGRNWIQFNSDNCYTPPSPGGGGGGGGGGGSRRGH